MRIMTYFPIWYIQQTMCTTATDTTSHANTFTPQHFMLCIFVAVVVCGAVTLIIDYQVSKERERIEAENKDRRDEIIWK